MSEGNSTPGDLNKIQEYIDKKSKNESLDTALLFFSSSISLLFTLISIFFGELLFKFLPILFLGWVMPVYIGFVRGCLIFDSVEERVRGWIYLIAGAGMYGIVIFWDYFELTGWFQLLIVLPAGTVGIIAYIFPYRILNMVGFELTDEIDNSYKFTFYSALFMMVFFILLIEIREIEEVLFNIIFLLIVAICAVYYEIKACRRLSSLIKNKLARQ